MKNKQLRKVILSFLLLVPFRLTISIILLKIFTWAAMLHGVDLPKSVIFNSVFTTKVCYDLIVSIFLCISCHKLFKEMAKYTTKSLLDYDLEIENINISITEEKKQLKEAQSKKEFISTYRMEDRIYKLEDSKLNLLNKKALQKNNSFVKYKEWYLWASFFTILLTIGFVATDLMMSYELFNHFN